MFRSIATVIAAICVPAGFLVAASDQADAQVRRRVPTFTAQPITPVRATRSAESDEPKLRIPIRDSETFVPKLTYGDHEFDGNWPHVVVQVEFFADNDTIHRRIYMEALEADDFAQSTIFGGGGATQVRGWSTPKLIYRAPRGKLIKYFDGRKKFTLVNQVVKGHGGHVFRTRLGRVTVYADHKGNDAETYTRVRIDFNYVLPVALKPSKKQDSQFVYVRLPQYLSFVPPHTQGDKDFHDNGPRVTINAQIVHSATTVGLGIYMRAKESAAVNTDPDTLAEGSMVQRLYTAPRGWRIKKIHGKSNWPAIVHVLFKGKYGFFETEIGKFNVYGDHKGDDAGSFTRLELMSKHSVRVELERNPLEGEVLGSHLRR